MLQFLVDHIVFTIDGRLLSLKLKLFLLQVEVAELILIGLVFGFPSLPRGSEFIKACPFRRSGSGRCSGVGFSRTPLLGLCPLVLSVSCRLLCRFLIFLLGYCGANRIYLVSQGGLGKR